MNAHGVNFIIPNINAHRYRENGQPFTNADNRLIIYLVESFKKEGQHPDWVMIGLNLERSSIIVQRHYLTISYNELNWKFQDIFQFAYYYFVEGRCSSNLLTLFPQYSYYHINKMIRVLNKISNNDYDPNAQNFIDRTNPEILYEKLEEKDLIFLNEFKNYYDSIL